MKLYTTLIGLTYLLSMSPSTFAFDNDNNYDGASDSYAYDDEYDHDDDDDDDHQDYEDDFKCKKPITQFSVVYTGDTAIDVVVYDKKQKAKKKDKSKKKGSVLQSFSSVENGAVLELTSLSGAKKEIFWELYEVGTNNKVGESLFDLSCKDKQMNEPKDCGNIVGHGKKEDEDGRYTTTWLFNGLTDKKGKSFECDLPEVGNSVPTITLLGNNNVSLQIGDDYIEPGFEGFDEEDGDLTAFVSFQSNLNTLEVGGYTVDYTLSDSDGNVATAVRNVTVSDQYVQIRTVQSTVTMGTNDAEQTSDGEMFLNSSDLELPFDDFDLQTNTVGIRFSNIGLPKGAIIQNAYVQFTADEVSYNIADIMIRAEKNNFASTFVSQTNNISARVQTEASVSWIPDAWELVGEAGEKQRTPDLKTIIQEVVSDSGYINSLAFILTGEGKRTAVAFESDPTGAGAGAPMLFIQYEGGTGVQTVTVSPNIKRVLSVNSFEYELVNAPDKGIVEIIEETGDFVYRANATAQGRDVLKFAAIDVLSGTGPKVFDINLTPPPVILNGIELANFSSNLPLLILDTNDKTIPDDPKIKGVMTIIRPDSSGRSSLTATPEYSDFMEVELRGSSSLQFPKNGFGIDTEMADGEDNDVSLLDMPEEHKWTMHGPYSDKSLMRNYIAYNKTREMGGVGYNAVRTKYVEVLLQEGDSYSYHGIYVFAEKIKRDENRLDISKLKSDETLPEDITGGYIMKQDREKDDWFFRTDGRDSKVVVDYPSTKNLNIQQKEYIQGFMNEFEEALFGHGAFEPDQANYYGNYIEPESFIKHLLSRELFRDVDTWTFSEFFHKDKGGKLSMLPVWDFNLGMGNANYGYNGSTEGWEYKSRYNGTGGWMRRLMVDNNFRDLVLAKFTDLRANEWSDQSLNDFIDETKVLLSEAQVRNFQRWPILGTYVWPNRTACDGGTALCDTWEKAVDQHLRTWLLTRIKWMEDNFPERVLPESE